MDDELVEGFLADGFVRIEGAFAPRVAEDCARLLWRETGYDPDDPGTWKEPVVWVQGMAQRPFAAGLWRSTDSGVSWSQVTNFPNVGNRSSTSVRTAAPPSRRPRRAGCRAATACASRRCPAPRATSGSRAAPPTARTACGPPTDGAASFTELAGVEQADTIGFGKAATGASYQTLYTSAKIGGVRGVFRSTDEGATWTRINDDAHQRGWTGGAITGDPRVYGRVYVSTNGRGVVYGDTSDTGGGGGGGTEPTPTPTGACTVTYKITNQWSDGFQADVRLANTGSTAWSGWSLGWSFADGQKISQLWKADYTQSGAAVTAKNVSWNGGVAAGSSVSFGFTGSWSGANTRPAAFTLGDQRCTVT